jgi:transcriptional regulator with XRE-family HTH domain
MLGERLRASRESAGLSQQDLAVRAGVSRQLVGAVETGRHLPRVDSALALAEVLGVTVDSLFGTLSVPIDIAGGGTTPDGALVRVGRIGNQSVTAPIRVGPEGWDAADGIVTEGQISTFDVGAPGIIVGGCEPGLVLLERMLRAGGSGAVAVSLTSTSALECLLAGRLHAAVVHGPEPDLVVRAKALAVTRFHLARWQVGIAAGPDATKGWWKQALTGKTPVVQREPGAGVQRAFRDAVPKTQKSVPGPLAASHLEAARWAMAMNIPAVTIEPAARAVGAGFHPIEVHSAQLWVGQAWVNDGVVEEAMAILVGSRFRRQLAGVGGYDLEGLGTRAA